MDHRDRGTSNVRFAAFVCALIVSLLVSFGAAAAGEDVSPIDTSDYRISAEDVLRISVWKEQGLNQKVVVRPDGGISFPLAGDVTAAGKTPKEVEAEIAQRLQRYIPDAVVTVSVLELKGLRIY